MPRLLVVNGPNLNLLGQRQPAIYGNETLADIEARLRQAARHWVDLELRFFQSNAEGAILDWLQEEGPQAAGIILNPGGLTHGSVCLRDVVEALERPCVEVHLSNIHGRERFRRRSLVAGVCVGSICGFGAFGYEAALEALARRLGLERRS